MGAMTRKLAMVLALCGVSVLASATAASAADSVYWSDYGNNLIGRAALAGGGGVDLAVSPVPTEGPFGIAIDGEAGKVFWPDFDDDTIGFASADGSSSGLLSTAGTSIGEPSGIAVDTAAGRVYWANRGTDTISFVNLDGSGGGDLNTGAASFADPFAVAIDPVAGRIYWANYEDSTIDFANLDGSGGGPLNILGPAPDGPDGLAIDRANGRIYWTNYSGDSIGYSNLDGSGAGLLDTTGAPIEGPAGLAIDPAAGRVYWANEDAETLAFASLGGGGGGTVETGGATATEDPSFPALFKAPEPRGGPTLSGGVEVGSTLGCRPGGWAPDLPESFLAQAPQSTAMAWTFNGATVDGATGPTLAVTKPGAYACQSIATSAAGSTTENSASITIPASTASPKTTATTAAPPTSIKLTKVKFDKHHGTATVLVNVSGPGTLTLSGKKVLRRTVKSSGAGIAKLKVAAKGKARKALVRNGKANVRITVRFVTTEGASISTVRALTLRRQSNQH